MRRHRPRQRHPRVRRAHRRRSRARRRHLLDRRRRVGRHHRPIRLRQIHPGQHARLPRPPTCGALKIDGSRRRRHVRQGARPLPRRQDRLHLPAIPPDPVPHRARKRHARPVLPLHDRRGRSPRRARAKSASASAPTICPASFPAASSSASASPAPSSTTHPSCLPTSPPAISTRPTSASSPTSSPTSTTPATPSSWSRTTRKWPRSRSAASRSTTARSSATPSSPCSRASAKRLPHAPLQLAAQHIEQAVRPEPQQPHVLLGPQHCTSSPAAARTASCPSTVRYDLVRHAFHP